MMGQMPNNQKGVALVVAILVVALATIVAAEMAFEGHVYLRRAASLRLTDQAKLFAIGAEDWGAEILKLDFEEQDGPANDNLNEYWAYDLPPLPLTDADGQPIGQMLGQIVDLQARFNINNLVSDNGGIDPAALEQFQCILTALDLEVTVATKIADWIDADSEPAFPDGAEDDVYTGLEPPYLTANTSVTSVSEILAVEGVTREIHTILAPYIVALPEPTRINVNTVEQLHDEDVLPTLQCLEPNLNQGDAENIIDARPEDGFSDMNEFVQASGIQDANLANALAQLESRYFQAKIRVSIGTFQLSMYSLLYRGQNGDVTTLLRTFGAE